MHLHVYQRAAAVCLCLACLPCPLTAPQSTLNSVMGEWSALVLRAFQAPGSTKSPWSVVFRDALLRRLTLRFVLCRAALTLHTTAGRNPAHLPTVFPELPKEVSV